MSMTRTTSSATLAAHAPGANDKSHAHDKPFCVMIRAARYAESSLDTDNWTVLSRYRTRQDALKAIAEHQRDPRHLRQFQYRLV